MGASGGKEKQKTSTSTFGFGLHRAGAALVFDEALSREEGRTPAGCLGLRGQIGIRLLPEAAYVVVALDADSTAAALQRQLHHDLRHR